MTGCALPGLGIGNDLANVKAMRFGLFLPNRANFFYDWIFPHRFQFSSSSSLECNCRAFVAGRIRYYADLVAAFALAK